MVRWVQWIQSVWLGGFCGIPGMVRLVFRGSRVKTNEKIDSVIKNIFLKKWNLFFFQKSTSNRIMFLGLIIM